MQTIQAVKKEEVSAAPAPVSQFLPPPSPAVPQKLIEKIERAIRFNGPELGESRIWEMLAAGASPDWVTAKSRLMAQQADLEDRLSPDKVPLGLIGLALDAGELDAARGRHTTALAHFTVVDEDLRQQPAVHAAYERLMAVHETLCRSAELSAQALAATEKLARTSSLQQKNKGMLSGLFGRSHKKEPAAAISRHSFGAKPHSP